jgi:hypothetical protein
VERWSERNMQKKINEEDHLVGAAALEGDKGNPSNTNSFSALEMILLCKDLVTWVW